VDVEYNISYTMKQRRLLRGDLHTHTVVSDGVLKVRELAEHARGHGLDFVAVTDHNVLYEACAADSVPGITLIPGMEWTLFKGHSNFLGLQRPLCGSYIADTPQEIRERFTLARTYGALVCVNHPCAEYAAFKTPLDELDFDCMEVWNGPMNCSNLEAIALWQRLLVSGRRIAACAGSDYHYDALLLFIGGPTTCVWADSASAGDIIDAVRRGRSYMVYHPKGPAIVSMTGTSPGEPKAEVGEIIRHHEGAALEVALQGLAAGDELLVLNPNGQRSVHVMRGSGVLNLHIVIDKPGFAALMLVRNLYPSEEKLPVLLSNPVYFE